MARRRTVREPGRSSITLPALSDCLFAGMGIVGQTENCVGTLPLSMTPSGGARNPYEAYVYARSVEGLQPGFYHYAAIDHTLARVDVSDLPLPSDLLGGQQWTDAMPCVLLLYARFERTMWKYDDANAYRVVLIEAGHIGQNIMLAATRNGLSACPTAALNHTRINDCIAPRARLTHAPIYALTLSYPGAEEIVTVHERPAAVVNAAHP
jgi:SagB-type dehydrogenase family enzyme